MLFISEGYVLGDPSQIFSDVFLFIQNVIKTRLEQTARLYAIVEIVTMYPVFVKVNATMDGREVLAVNV